MRRALLTAAFALLGARAHAAPDLTPEQAVAKVMSRMRAELRYAPEVPQARGPHEWNAPRVLGAGTVNGCVESAKAFFTLFHGEFPAYKAVYLDSFNATGEGGHAVVAVTGSDGKDFIVDAASFEKIPGPVSVDEAALNAPIDIRPKRTGRIFQFRGRGDLLAEKSGDEYRMILYPPSQVFDGPVILRRSFKNITALNQELARFASAAPTDFAWLRDHGLILPFADPERTSFIYPDPAGGLARYIVYGRFETLPVPDDAERREPAARALHAKAAGR